MTSETEALCKLVSEFRGEWREDYDAPCGSCAHRKVCHGRNRGCAVWQFDGHTCGCATYQPQPLDWTLWENAGRLLEEMAQKESLIGLAPRIAFRALAGDARTLPQAIVAYYAKAFCTPSTEGGNNIVEESSAGGDDESEVGGDGNGGHSYSFIRHLSMVLLGARWRDQVYGMLTSYCDASGSEGDQLVLSVAGFVSKAQDWIAFEPLWLERLKEDGLSYLHVKEINGAVAKCRNHNGCDNHWTPQRRATLFLQLAGIIRANSYHKIGCTVVVETVSGMSIEIKERFLVCAYSLAAVYCGCQLRRFALLEMKSRNEPIMVFEDGDKGKGQTEALFKRLKWSEPQFRPGKHDVVMKDGLTKQAAIPLQAADLLAYNLFEMNRRIETGGPINLRSEYREVFDRMNCVPQKIEKGRIDQLESMLRNEEFLEGWMDGLNENKI